MRRYHSLILLFSLVMGAILLLGSDENQPLYGQDNYLSLCWIKRFRTNSSTTSPYFWLLFAAPLAVMYGAALLALAASRTRLVTGLKSTFRLRLTVLANRCAPFLYV